MDLLAECQDWKACTRLFRESSSQCVTPQSARTTALLCVKRSPPCRALPAGHCTHRHETAAGAAAAAASGGQQPTVCPGLS